MVAATATSRDDLIRDRDSVPGFDLGSVLGFDLGSDLGFVLGFVLGFDLGFDLGFVLDSAPDFPKAWAKDSRSVSRKELGWV